MSALQKTNLAPTLAGGPFTLFAPTNAAFSKLPWDTLNKLMANFTALTGKIWHLSDFFVKCCRLEKLYVCLSVRQNVFEMCHWEQDYASSQGGVNRLKEICIFDHIFVTTRVVWLAEFTFKGSYCKTEKYLTKTHRMLRKCCSGCDTVRS